jgi:hypothetical protein
MGSHYFATIGGHLVESTLTIGDLIFALRQPVSRCLSVR